MPIRVTLVTRNGFSKHIKFGEGTRKELQRVLVIRILDPMPTVAAESALHVSDIPTTVCRQLEFELKRWRVTQQKNGLEHLVAVYEEARP
jgi:hypothetical protein